MSVPRLITVPLPEQLPFIDSKFSESKQISTVTWKRSGGLLCTDEEPGKNLPKWPGMVGDDVLYTIAALSQENFEAILSVIRPNISGSTILNTNDLDKITRQSSKGFREYFVIDEDHDNFTDDQLKVFLLIGANFEQHADWRKIARLYNAAPDDQKNAMSEFFVNLRLFGLEELMSAAPDMKVPEALLSTKTKEIDGDVYVHCDIAKDWVRDDRFHRQFKVTMTLSFSQEPTVIAYAGTLEQAIARATAYTLGKNGVILDADGKPKVIDKPQKQTSGAVCIYFETDTSSRVVAIANLRRHLKTLPDSITESDCRLEWGPAKTLEPFTDQGFRKALFATEKLLGVSWSKAFHLEDALGL
jgi:hypothetical protein